MNDAFATNTNTIVIFYSFSKFYFFSHAAIFNSVNLRLTG